MTSIGILAIIQAGGAGGRMDVLTLERAKPALPFAGSYQLLDFSLSNLVNSRIDDVWLSVQYQSSALQDQVRNGRPWDLDRTHGGLRLLVPQQGSGSLDEDGFAQGNADELYRLRDQIRAADPELVVVMSADHVYRLDFREVVATHRAKKADVTLVTTDLATTYAEQAGDHAVVGTNRLGRVTSFAYKPEDPASTTVAAEVIVYDPDVLVRDPRGAAPRALRRAATRATTTSATPVWATSATCWCPGWSRGAGSTPTTSTATGATSASRTTTSTPTSSCCAATPASSTAPGRCAPSSRSASPPGCSTGRGSAESADQRRRRRRRHRLAQRAGPRCRRSRPARRSPRASCSPTPSSAREPR